MMCSDPWTREHLPDLVRGELSPGETARVMAHMETCPLCAEERSLIEALEGIDVPEPGHGFWSDLPKRIMEGARRGRGAGLKDVRIQWLGGLAAAAVAAALLLFLLVPGTPTVDNMEEISGIRPLSLVDLGPEQDLLSREDRGAPAVEDALEIDLGLTEEDLALLTTIPGPGYIGKMIVDPGALNDLEKALDEMSSLRKVRS